ncbi:MAG: cation transporter [Euryarchaeota archaeon]|nr:cation transporter [Euryarchaeota archaeon]
MGVRTFEFAVPAHEGCGGCARRLHEQVAVLAGVRSVTADFARGVVRVEADEEGYVEADLSTRVEQSLADAHPSSPLASTTSRKHDAHELAELNGRRLLIAFGVGAAIMAVEVVGALASNSLVLLADAAHYATDLAAILLAFLAVRWSVKAATSRKTFGYERAEVPSMGASSPRSEP